MSQNAIVKEKVSDGVVRVSLLRQMQCGSDCDSCKGCIARPTGEIIALASDPIGTGPGDWVEVESVGATATGAAMLVYLLPCLTLLGGYLVGAALGLSEGGAIAAGAVGLLLGFLPARLVDRAIRKRAAPEFRILGLKQV